MQSTGKSGFDVPGPAPASALAVACELVGIAAPVGLLLEIGLVLISPGCGPPS